MFAAAASCRVVYSRIGDSPNYELATGFVPPRRVMLGAKLTF